MSPLHRARFVGALLVLNGLPFVPAAVSPMPVSPYFPLSVDVLVLVTVAVLTASTRWARAGRIAATAGIFFLLAYQTYDAIVHTAFQRSGLAYEDLQYVVDLAYLATDNLSWASAGSVGLGLLGLAGLGWLVPACVRVVARIGRRDRPCRLGLAAVHVVAWPLVLVVAPLQNWGPENLTYQTSNERTRVRTVAAKVTENVQASARLHAMLDTLGTAGVDSAYSRFDRLRLRERPHVYLYMIESYGEVTVRHPDLKAPFAHALGRLDSLLTADGWHAATTLSDAPVRGGRSWLAISTVMTGTRIAHQLVHERFLQHADRAPHLVRFFNQQGYRTVTLQPYTLARPGLPMRNTYGFDVEIYRDDIPYNGPPYGWGVVPMPDQVSLGHATEAHLRPAAEAGTPVFFFFETVMSHALWNYGVPPVPDDWRAFERQSGSDWEQKQALDTLAGPPMLLPDSIRAPRIFDQPAPMRYLRHIEYELRVLLDHLRDDAPPNSLVILMGDHQPPILTTDTFGVPVHVLSRSPAQVAAFEAAGWDRGMRFDRTTGRMKHHTLYPTLVRALAGPDSMEVQHTVPP